MKETRICCKVVSKTNDEQIKNNKIKNLYLHMFGDIAATWFPYEKNSTSS